MYGWYKILYKWKAVTEIQVESGGLMQLAKEAKNPLTAFSSQLYGKNVQQHIFLVYSRFKDLFLSLISGKIHNLMLKAVLVDDESKALQSLSWELSNLNNEVDVIASFTNAHRALDYLDKNTPDCLFLDIEMPIMDGFQFIKNLKNKNFPIIITTAYNQYALKALKNQALDYLLKPIDTDDLHDTVLKIKKHNGKRHSAEQLEQILLNFNANSFQRKITISTDGKLLFLESEEILYAESDGNYSTIYLEDGQKILLTKKLKEIDQLLPSDAFFRIHNSFVVNLGKIKEFLKTDGYVVLRSGQKIPVSRQKKSDFLDLF